MLRIWKMKLRQWIAGVCAMLFNRFCDLSVDREVAMIDDYLRVQSLRRSEEERFRAQYLGPRV